MQNADVRNALKSHGVYIYELADVLGVSEPTLIRWLRKEWTEEQKAKAFDLIRMKAGEKHDENH